MLGSTGDCAGLIGTGIATRAGEAAAAAAVAAAAAAVTVAQTKVADVEGHI